MVALAAQEDEPSPELEKAYSALVKKLLKNQLNGSEIDVRTLKATAQDFMAKVFEGYGGDFTSFDYDTPDYEKLLNLEQSVYSFSGAKNWQMLRELTDAVRNTNTEKDYLEESGRIGGEYNKLYRQTERITALHSAANASKEVDFARHPEAIIEFRVSDLEKACEICGPLDRLRLPANDPKWFTYSPLLHWRCGCYKIRTNETESTPDRLLPSDALIDPMFSGMSQNGLTFPKGSAYYINCPKDIIKQATSLIPNRKK